MIQYHKIRETAPYISWVYFFHAWGFQPRFAAIANIHGCDACRASWLTSFPVEERPKASEAMQLFKEANRMLDELDADFEIKTIFRLYPANSDGDNLVFHLTDEDAFTNGRPPATIDGKPKPASAYDRRLVFPLLRQQMVRREGGPFLCLSDFVRPLSSGVTDTVGVFASSVENDMERLYEQDPYKRILVQTLADRLAEAATEKMHEYVRKVAWGYAPDEQLSYADLLVEKYQGIRPAVGYPSLPDQSINFLLDELLDMRRIGITLTENGAMNPHASVCGLMFAHPASEYFAIGKIADDQLVDYARRRGVPVEELKKFLAANLQ